MEVLTLRLKNFLHFLKKAPRIFQPKLKKIKKNPPRKNCLYFRKWNFLGLILKKIQETETPKKIPYISGNGNPEKAS